MPNYIRLPDGSLYEAPEGATQSQAYAKARQDYPEVFGIAPAKPETGFIPNLKAGFENLKGDIGAIGAGIGIEGGAEYAKAQREKAGQIATTPEFSDDPFSYVTSLLGQSAAYMAAPVLGAAALGSAPVAGALGLGTLAAGTIGAGLASATQFTGSNLSRQLEEGTAPEDLKLGAAVAAAIPQAALDVTALKFLPGVNRLLGRFGREATKEEALRAARKLAEASAAGVIKAGGVKTLQTMGIEGLTEAGQQVFERMQANLDLMDEQARGEYLDNFIGGATLGGLFGAGSRIGAQGRAKAEVGQEDRRVANEEALVQQQAEEKARSTPEALRALAETYTRTRSQLDDMNAQLKVLKPGKNQKQTPEEKTAYRELKTKRDELADQFRAINTEYAQRKPLIDALPQQPTTTVAAQTQQAAPPAGSAITLSDQYDTLRKQLYDVEGQFAAGPDVETTKQLLEQRQQLQAQMQELAPAVTERGGVTFDEAQLNQEDAKLTAEEARINETLAKAETARLNAQQEGDFEKTSKIIAQIESLQAQLQEVPGKRESLAPHRLTLEQLRARQGTAPGATTPMFTESTEGEKPRATPLKFENVEGTPVTGMATAKKTADQQQAQADKAAVPTAQITTVKQAEQELARVVAEARKVKNINLVGPQQSWGGPFTIQGARGTQVSAALKKLDEAEASLSRTQSRDNRKRTDPIMDLFDPTNLLREAFSRGDTRTLLNIRRATDSAALNAALDEKLSERERLVNTLNKMTKGEAKIQRTRANLFNDLYTPSQRSEFANGTNQEVIERQKTGKDGTPVFNKRTGEAIMERIPLQQVYDNGGAAAVEYEVTMDKVAEASRKATVPQGNAKKSLYAQAVELYGQLEVLETQQESGIAVPTMDEKVQGLQAKQGKAEAPGKREMTPKERDNLRRKIMGLTNRYNSVIAQLTPVRDAVLSIYNSLYTTKEVTAEEAKTRKAAEDKAAKKETSRQEQRSGYLQDFALRYGEESDAYAKFAETTTNTSLLREKAIELGKKDPRFKQAFDEEMQDRRDAGEFAEKPKSAMSREARTQKRIEGGNVRKDAAKSVELEKLAMDAGMATPEMEVFNKNLSKRMAALARKYDATDPAVAEFRIEMGSLREQKARELGKKTKEYRAALAEKTKKLQEALAGASAAGFKQEVRSKRTKQETRDSSGAPKTLRTGGAETTEGGLAGEGIGAARKGAQDFLSVPSRATLEQPTVDVVAQNNKAAAADSARVAQEIRQHTPAQKRKAKQLDRELEKEVAILRGIDLLRGVETESVALSGQQVRMLEKNDLPGAFAAIVTDERIDPVSRTIAKILRGFLDYTSVQIEETLVADGKTVLGAANTNNIWLNRNGGLSIEALLHEGTHSAAERVVQLAETNPSALTAGQRAAINELRAIFNVVKNDPAFTSFNAKTGLTEFVAEVMSNLNLQKQLSKRKWQMSDMMNAIKSVILRLLGIRPAEVETMLGAAMVSVEALFVPTSQLVGGSATGATIKEARSMSAKDIAALHTGSNSMRQFAEQFGPVIKAADRTPEDVERIALQQMDAILNSPNRGTPVATKESITAYFKRLATMSDGEPYNPDNLLHYAEATAETLAAVEALESKPADIREDAAIELNQSRARAIAGLFNYLTENYTNYTLAEAALVIKAATQFGVTSVADGKLKLVKLDKNNEHPVAVIGGRDTDAIIEELRAGASLKDAFIGGMQKAADAAAKKNTRLNGWKKFAQSDKHEAAVELNDGAANTPWCTGSSLDFASNQIKGGDFYIYYANGKPEVAVRMDGQARILEVRGTGPGQALTGAQEKTAESFLQNSSFVDKEEYLRDFALKRALIESARTGKHLPESVFLQISPRDAWLDGDGAFQESEIEDALKFRSLNGYSNKRTPSDAIIKDVKAIAEDSLMDLAEEGRFVFIDLDLNKGPDGEALVKPFEILGTKFSPKVSEIKSVGSITVGHAFRDTPLELPSLENLQILALFRAVVTLPKLKTLRSVNVYEDATLNLDPDVKIGEIRATTSDTPFPSLTINGAKNLGEVELSKINNKYRYPRAINVVAPDALYANVSSAAPEDLKTGIFIDAFARFITDTDMPGATYPVVQRMLRSPAGEFATATERANKELVSFISRKVKTFARDLRDLKDDPSSSARTLRPKLGVRGDFNKYWSDLEARVAADPDLNLFSTAINEAFIYATMEQDVSNEELARAANRAFVGKDGAVDPRLNVAFSPNTFKAPNWVAARPPTQTLTEAAEKINFAPKNVGVIDEGKGIFSFKRRAEPISSVIASPPGVIDTFWGNVLGLAGRVQMVDALAAVEEVTRRGKAAGKISGEEATNASYLLRFGQQVTQFAGQFMTNGAIRMETQKRNGVTISLYRSTQGTSMVDVAQTLAAAKLGTDTEQEYAFTLYLAGKRASDPKVGWDKLNVKDATKAKAEYASVLQRLALNPQAKTAFEAAAKQYQQYNAGLMDFLVQTGYLTEAKAAELKAITFVPFYRIRDGEVELMIDRATPVRIANIKDEPQLQELVGGADQILPIFTSAAQNTFMLTRMGLRNQGVKETAFMLLKLGVASRISQGMGPAGKDVVRFKRKGKDYYVKIDTDQYGVSAELMVRGMEGIKTTLPAIFKLMGIPATILRNFVVRMPSYAVRQIVRDPLNAWLTNGTDAIPVFSSMKELASMVAGRSEVERQLMETGAISSNIYSGDARDMAKFTKNVSTGRSGWDMLMARADAFALQGDAATRAVIYKDSLEKGMYEQEALLRTLESMNFSRRGVDPSMHILSVLIPFFNAQIQGLDVIYRSFKGDLPFSEQLQIRQKLVRRALLMAGMSVAYTLLMEDDDTYKNARPEERYANWFVPNPFGEGAIRVPIPFELGFLFKALPEAVINVAFGDDRADRALKGLGKMLDQSNPFSLPQAVKPLTEVVLGRSFFGGDVESMREREQMLATSRYRDNTTEVSKLLGSLTGQFGVSAISLDHLVRGYTGGMGIAVLALANPILASDVKSSIATPSMKPNQIPLIGGLFQNAEGRGTLDEAYDRMMQIRQVKGEYNRLVQLGQREKAQEFALEYADEISLMSVSGSVQQRLGALAATERKIKANPAMTTAQKDERLKRLYEAKMRVANQFLALGR